MLEHASSARSGAARAAGLRSSAYPLRIVALGGGTGLPAVLRALRHIVGPAAPATSLTAIVAVTDDGGSSGRLRRELSVLPPGDARNCVAALAGDASPLAAVLQHRFGDESPVSGHPIGNLLLAALTQQLHGDFASAVEMLGRMVGMCGRVLPATADDVHLKAEYIGGEVVVGETAIAARRLPIRRLSLERPVRPVPEALEALVNADVIVLGPGSLYTSILPVLLVDGLAPTIFGLRATRIYVSNLMTEPGETDGYTLDDHLEAIRQHTGFDLFDYILVNRQPVAPDALAEYARRHSMPVAWSDQSGLAGAAHIVPADLAAEQHEHKIRHEPSSLARAIQGILGPSLAKRPDTPALP